MVPSVMLTMKIAALIRIGHQVNSFVFSFAAVVSFRLPGILEGETDTFGIRQNPVPENRV